MMDHEQLELEFEPELRPEYNCLYKLYGCEWKHYPIEPTQRFIHTNGDHRHSYQYVVLFCKPGEKWYVASAGSLPGRYFRGPFKQARLNRHLKKHDLVVIEERR